MAEKKEKPTLGVYVRIEETGSLGYGYSTTAWIRAYVVSTAWENGERKFSFASRYGGVEQYRDLVFQELISADRPDGSSWGELKGNPGNGCSVWELTKMAKNMGKIVHQIQKLNAKHGTPWSFAQGVLRLAAVADAECIITDKTEEGRKRTGLRYSFDDLTQGEYCIGRRLQEWYEAHGPKKDQEVTA